jgi:hypothetical protein
MSRASEDHFREFAQFWEFTGCLLDIRTKLQCIGLSAAMGKATLSKEVEQSSEDMAEGIRGDPRLLEQTLANKLQRARELLQYLEVQFPEMD